jgi:hypothetical protein
MDAAAVKSATVYVTGKVSGDKQKVLGAYRLTINGRAVAVGPGRGECSFAHPVMVRSSCVDALTLTLNLNLNLTLTLTLTTTMVTR